MRIRNVKNKKEILSKHGIEYEENRLNNGTRFYVFQNLFGRLPMKEYFIFENDIYGDITSDFVKIELYNYEPFPVKYDNLKIAVDYANMKEEFEVFHIKENPSYIGGYDFYLSVPYRIKDDDYGVTLCRISVALERMMEKYYPKFIA